MITANEVKTIAANIADEFDMQEIAIHLAENGMPLDEYCLHYELHQCLENYTCISGFEFTAKAINESDSPYELWDLFDEVIAESFDVRVDHFLESLRVDVSVFYDRWDDEAIRIGETDDKGTIALSEPMTVDEVRELAVGIMPMDLYDLSDSTPFEFSDYNSGTPEWYESGIVENRTFIPCGFADCLLFNAILRD